MEDTLEEIRRVHPPDVAGYENLLSVSKAIFEVGF